MTELPFSGGQFVTSPGGQVLILLLVSVFYLFLFCLIRPWEHWISERNLLVISSGNFRGPFRFRSSVPVCPTLSEIIRHPGRFPHEGGACILPINSILLKIKVELKMRDVETAGIPCLMGCYLPVKFRVAPCRLRVSASRLTGSTLALSARLFVLLSLHLKYLF